MLEKLVEGVWEAWLGSGQGIAAGLLITERESDIQACGDLSDTDLLGRMERDLKLSPRLHYPLPIQCTCTELHDTFTAMQKTSSGGPLSPFSLVPAQFAVPPSSS